MGGARIILFILLILFLVASVVCHVAIRRFWWAVAVVTVLALLFPLVIAVHDSAAIVDSAFLTSSIVFAGSAFTVAFIVGVPFEYRRQSRDVRIAKQD